ncbi:MAG: EAL domain-containing protein, partial [Thermosynechococcaceae cyanobacterium]
RLSLNTAFFRQHLQGARQRMEQIEARANASPTPSLDLQAETIYELSVALEELYVATEEIQAHNEQLLIVRQELALEHRRYQDLFDFAPDGYVVTTTDGVIQSANHAAENLFKIARDKMVGKPLIVFVVEADCHQFHTQINQLTTTQRLTDWEVTLQPRRGSPFPALITITAMRDLQGHCVGLRWSIRDISELKLALQMHHDAFHDSLTGLFNRALLLDRLQHLLQRYQRHPDQLFALLFLDLDRFKGINDSLGHLAGDRVLVEMACRLQTCLREEDTLARLGGDEFVVLLEDIHSLSEVEACATRLQDALAIPFTLKNHSLVLQGSIGIVLSHPQYRHPEELLRDADLAMYQAKQQGGACFHVFTSQMHINALNAFQLEQELHQALQRQELEVHYQPIIQLSTQKLSGFEALVRWQHPQLGLLSPSEFLSVAIETGLIVTIDLWVLRTACQQMVEWQTELGLMSPLTISVNISSRLFALLNFVEVVQTILQDTGIDPRSLTLEITEGVIMTNIEQAATTLHQLRALQVQLTIDDFGTGFSSLSRLQQLPFHGLKIDRTFLIEPGGIEMIKAIILMAHTLGLYVITEGVETADQVQILSEINCEFAQGYYFGCAEDHCLARLRISS